MKKNVFVSGTFNVLHPGHLRILRFAKSCGDYLIVGIESDKIAGSFALIPENMRKEVVLASNLADEVHIISESPEDYIKKYKPDIVVKGKEHEKKFNKEQPILDSYGGKLIFGSGETVFSSTELINKEFFESTKDLSINPSDFLNRHDLKKDNLIDIINKFKSIKTCIIGDMIIDEYITCEPLGLSQEEPSIVVTPLDSRTFIGGAGIVASHASGLGSESTIISVCGNDSKKEFAKKQLKTNNVNSILLVDENRPTTLKQRYRSEGKSLLRVNHLHQDNISKKLQNEIFDKFNSIVNEIDLLIFSDFNYGCLPIELINKLITLSKKNNVTVAADCQSSSQYGDITKYKNINLICPTEKEARVSLKNFQDGLVVILDELRFNSNPENIILKLGAEGILVQSAEQITRNWIVDRLPALNIHPKDPAGAGDSMLIASALSLSVDSNIWESAILGSISASIQVSRTGNIPLKADELINLINRI